MENSSLLLINSCRSNLQGSCQGTTLRKTNCVYATSLPSQHFVLQQSSDISLWKLAFRSRFFLFWTVNYFLFMHVICLFLVNFTGIILSSTLILQNFGMHQVLSDRFSTTVNHNPLYFNILMILI